MSFEHVIRGNIEALEQGIHMLEKISNEEYVFIPEPYVNSSIGAHFRHILDMFTALKSDTGGVFTEIDYDIRRRGADVETQREFALQELKNIRLYMLEIQGLSYDQKNPKLLVKTEVTISDTHSVILESSLLRELIFVGSHAIHHYAIVTIIAKLQNIELGDFLGMAPATVSYLRSLSAKTEIADA